MSVLYTCQRKKNPAATSPDADLLSEFRLRFGCHSGGDGLFGAQPTLTRSCRLNNRPG